MPFHRYTFENGTVWTEFYRTTTGYLLRFPGLADFEVSADGDAVNNACLKKPAEFLQVLQAYGKAGGATG